MQGSRNDSPFVSKLRENSLIVKQKVELIFSEQLPETSQRNFFRMGRSIRQSNVLKLCLINRKSKKVSLPYRPRPERPPLRLLLRPAGLGLTLPRCPDIDGWLVRGGVPRVASGR